LRKQGANVVNDDATTNIGRRGALRKGAMLAGASFVPLLARAIEAKAAAAYGSVPQASVNYVAQTANGHQCEDCKFFIAAALKTAPGHCTVVAGSIARHGSCKLWTALPKGTPDNG
jgi:High potential iron-sulfur protein